MLAEEAAPAGRARVTSLSGAWLKTGFFPLHVSSRQRGLCSIIPVSFSSLPSPQKQPPCNSNSLLYY